MTPIRLANTFGGIVRPICLAVFKLMLTRISSAAPREVGGLCAFENLVHIRGGPPVHIGIAWPIGHQAARLDQFTVRMHSRQAVLGGESMMRVR